MGEGSHSIAIMVTKEAEKTVDTEIGLGGEEESGVWEGGVDYEMKRRGRRRRMEYGRWRRRLEYGRWLCCSMVCDHNNFLPRTGLLFLCCLPSLFFYFLVLFAYKNFFNMFRTWDQPKKVQGRLIH